MAKMAYRNSKHYNLFDKITLILNILVTLLVIRLLNVTELWKIVLYAVVISGVLRITFEWIYVILQNRKNK
jgi:uncharacterized MnhB-related membrane protein